MPFACIFVPDFPVEAIMRAEPDLRSQAVAILEGKPPLQKICALNEEARQVGISAGMSKLQAEVCDAITLRERSELQESSAHQALLDCAQSFSPRVQECAADTLLLDVSGLEKLIGAPTKIAREMFRRACAMGLEANVAVASTIEAAQIAAHGFSGVTIVPEKKEAELLGSLPVEVLFYDEPDSDDAEEFLATLHGWGIRKLGELTSLPEVALSERLGQRGLELQRKARGVSSSTLVPSDPPLVFEEAQELEFPLVLLEPLAFILNRMLEHLCARLEGRALAAQELYLELQLEGGYRAAGGQSQNCFQRVIKLPVPLLDPKTFLKLLQLDLKAHPPGAPVKKVSLRMEPAKPRPAQDGLFMPASPQPEKLELTLARLSGIVGEGRAASPALLDTHRPEAFEMRHFVPAASKNGNGCGTQDLVTALRIFRPPVCVHVQQADGKLLHISSKKNSQISGPVLWAAGPWRSSGDWWDQDPWARDEWDVALEEKNSIVLYRLIHDLLSGKWMVEGTYD
jgi:protein ImuB